MNLYEIRQELMTGKSIFDLHLRVSYYTRVSTSLEDQLNSLKSQTQYYEEFIRGVKNWIFVDAYIDEGISGTSVRARKDFNRMVEDAKQKKFDLLITKEVSRFARNTLDSIYYTRELLSNGVGVYFQSDNINTLMPDSELRLTIMASMAQEESRKISERTKWGKKRKVEQGKMHLTGRINGYDVVDGKYVINEKEAEMIRLIFDLYCNNIGFRRIADILYNKGYKNENGNKYGYSTLKRILTNPRYKGFFTANQTVTVDFLTKEYVNIPKEDWISYFDPEQSPPIVNQEIWDKANKLLEEKSEKVALKHETSYQNKYKYSGKIQCKEHQNSFYRTMYRYKSGNKEVWMCQEYHKSGKEACSLPVLYTEELDKVISVVLNDMHKNKDRYFDKLSNILNKLLKNKSYVDDINNLKNEIQQLNKKKDKLLELAINDVIDNKEFKNRNEEFNALINEKNVELDELIKLSESTSDTQSRLSQIKKFLETDYKFNEYVNDKVIDAFVEKIIVSKGEVENTVDLDIILKTGQEVKTVYSKDFSLSLIRHMEGDKLMLKLPRKINERGGYYDIMFNINNVSIVLNVA